MKKILAFTVIFIGLMSVLCFGGEISNEDIEELVKEAESMSVLAEGFNCNSSEGIAYALGLYGLDLIKNGVELETTEDTNGIYYYYNGSYYFNGVYYKIDSQGADEFLKDKLNITPKHNVILYTEGEIRKKALYYDEGYYYVSSWYFSDISQNEECAPIKNIGENSWYYMCDKQVVMNELADGRYYFTVRNIKTDENLYYVLAERKNNENGGYWSYYYCGSEDIAEGISAEITETNTFDAVSKSVDDIYLEDELICSRGISYGDILYVSYDEAVYDSGCVRNSYSETFDGTQKPADSDYINIEDFYEEYAEQLENTEFREKIKSIRSLKDEAESVLADEENENTQGYSIDVFSFGEHDIQNYKVYSKNNVIFYFEFTQSPGGISLTQYAEAYFIDGKRFYTNDESFFDDLRSTDAGFYEWLNMLTGKNYVY